MRFRVSSYMERICGVPMGLVSIGLLMGGILGAGSPEAPAAPSAHVQDADGDVLSLNMLENGDMEMGTQVLAGVGRIAWWTPVTFAEGSRDLSRAKRSWSGLDVVPRIEDGAVVLDPGSQDLLVQAVPTFAQGLDKLRISGRVRGAGVVVVLDAAGREYSLDVDGSDSWQEFAWDVGKVGPLTPRLTLGIGARSDSPVSFDDLALWVTTPAPSEAQLRAQLGALIPELLMVWHLGTKDDVGPRKSNLWGGLVDANTGGLLGEPAAKVGLHPMHMALVRATALGLGGPELKALCIDSARDFMELCVHPKTNLPRRWDPVRDVPVNEESIEVAAYLGYLLDLAEFGPEEVRQEAFEKAASMGMSLLRKAVLPDGNVAALVRPMDGEISTNTVHLRRLDLPAQFVRLAGVLRERGDWDELAEALVAAARDALIEVEFANYWPGQWNRIDPGFDDSYGHIGARSASMLKVLPDEAMLGRLAFSGLDKFAPLWRLALSHGGNIAADQVRCWEVFGELALLQPQRPMASGRSLGQEVSELLPMAVRSHLKGQQATGGHWLDVTVVGFDPATNLPVGDTVGMPQNLLKGMGVVYREEFGLRTAEHRALFAAALNSSLETYAAPFGLVGAAPGSAPGGGRGGGARSAVGTLQVMDGLLSMAENLAR
jgi:hypothetical protein